jgi:hypothetical protein
MYIYGNNNPYIFEQVTYSIHNLPTGTSVTWSGSNNVNIISGQGTGSVVISICSGSTATLTATLTGAVNGTYTRNLIVSNGDFTVNRYLDHIDVTFTTYSQCNDWYISSSFNNSGNISCINSYSQTLIPATGYTGGIVRARANSTGCTGSWIERYVSLWTPVIDYANSNLSPSCGEPYTFCLVESYPENTVNYVQYYWYYDNSLIDVTNTPSKTSYDWECGSHSLSIQLILNGNPMATISTSIYGECSGCGGGWGTWSAAYPNPSSNELIINKEEENNNELSTTAKSKIADKSSETTILLYSHGTTKLAYSKTYPASTKQIKIDTSKLPNGVYYLNIVENGEKVKQQTIIVNH